MTGGHGLTLGKFAPLHRGHQLVIETALAECERVTVVVYDAPSTTRVPLSVRAGWVRTLYPQVRVIEGWAGPEAVGDTPAVQRLHDHYLREVLGLTDVTAFYSSERYGQATAAGLGAVHRPVDPARTRWPVSGTAVRADPFGHQGLLDPVVYRDLVASVVLLGAPGSGKSTLAERLAADLDSVWMPEYGREFWHAHQQDRRLSPQQLVDLAEGHLEREEAMRARANQVLVVDTSALTTWRYAMNYHGAALPRLAELADESVHRHDLVVLCEPDFGYVETWDRSGEGERQRMHRQIEADLLVRRIPFLRARGTVDQRARTLLPVLAGLEPFTPWHSIARLIDRSGWPADSPDGLCGSTSCPPDPTDSPSVRTEEVR